MSWESRAAWESDQRVGVARSESGQALAEMERLADTALPSGFGYAGRAFRSKRSRRAPRRTIGAVGARLQNDLYCQIGLVLYVLVRTAIPGRLARSSCSGRGIVLRAATKTRRHWH